MSVFVRWYGSILQGDVVENQEKGILSGMVAVRIQVQGMTATALFAPSHVYASAEEIKGNFPIISSDSPIISENPREITRNDAKISIGDMNILKFKEENWDHQRNHLRIDALDQFYEMWKASCAPIFKPLKVEGNPEELAEAFKNYDGVIYNTDAPVVTLPPDKPQPIVSDKRMAELKTELKKSLKPVEAKQLSLFD